MNWMYKEKPINCHEDLLPECTDIVYELTYVDGRKYLGKKTVRSMSTLPVLKTKGREGSNLITRHILRDIDGKIITSKKGRKEARAAGLKAKAEYYEKIVTAKPFLKYEGSLDTKNLPDIKSKEILHQCSSKKAASYIETALLFHYEVLFTDEYLNENISGTYFDNSLDGLLEREEETSQVCTNK